MKCKKHISKDAIAQCEQCGAGVCNEGAEYTISAPSSYGILCVECYAKLMSNLIYDYKKENRKKITKVIISLILYFFGMIMIIMGLTTNELQMSFAGIIFCGLYTGLTWRKMTKDVHDQYEREHGASYTITENGVYREDGFFIKLIMFLIGTVFGVVITPFRVISDIVSVSKNKKTIKEFEYDILRISNL